MKKRIAICLSGQYRVFYLFKNLYKNLNNIYPDYHFDIFLSGWAHDEKSFGEIDFIARAGFYEDSLTTFMLGSKTDKNMTANNFNRLCYLMMKSSQLREEFELEKGFTYDAVLWTRSDVLIFPKTFQGLFDLVDAPYTAKVKISDAYVLNDIGIASVPKVNGDRKDTVYTNDRLAIGSSKSMSIYCNMYEHFFNPEPDRCPNPHVATALYTFEAKLGLREHRQIKFKIVRPTPWHGPVPPAKAREDVIKKMLSEIDIFDLYRKFDNAVIPNLTTHPLEI